MSVEELEAALEIARARIATLESEAAKVDEGLLRLLAHELRSPLAPVLTAVQLLEDEPSFSPDTRRWLSVVKRNALAESAMVDDTIELLRIRHHIVSSPPERADLQELVRSALQTLREEVAHKRIATVTAFSATRTSVMVQKARLQHAIVGLLRAALKATKAEGSIDLTLRDDGDRVVLSIAHLAGTPAFADALVEAISVGESALVPLGALGLSMLFARDLAAAAGSSFAAQHVDQKLIYVLTTPVV